MKFNFNKYDRSKIDSLGTPYDYGSVMHYDSRAFSRNGRPTIVARKPGVGFVSTLIIGPLSHIFKDFVSEGFHVSHQFKLEQFAQKTSSTHICLTGAPLNNIWTLVVNNVCLQSFLTRFICDTQEVQSIRKGFVIRIRR